MEENDIDVIDIENDTIIDIKPEPVEFQSLQEELGGNVIVRLPSSSDIGSLNLWTSRATTCLIKEYKQYHSMVGQTTQLRSIREMFEMISIQMQRYGYYFSPQKCENKWRVLERKYKNLVVRERLKKPGRMKHYGHWEHKKAMDEIFSEKKRHQYLDDQDFPPPKESAKLLEMHQNNAKDGNRVMVNGDITEQVAQANATLEAISVVPQHTCCTKQLETLIEQLNSNLLLGEEQKMRRHQEMMAIEQKKLEFQAKLLEVKEKKLELQRAQILAAAQRLQI